MVNGGSYGQSASALLEDLRRRLVCSDDGGGCGGTDGDRVSVGEVAAALGDRGPGALLLLLTLPALAPMPGVPAGVVFGTVITLLSLQMLAGRNHLWLPDWLARRSIGRNALAAGLQAAAKPLARLERWLTPRWRGLTGAGMLRRLSPLVFWMGFLIALPIPFGNVVPAFALIALSLGLMTHDGAAVGVGIVLSAAATLVSVALVVVGWQALGGG